jgi:hypothetical protein
MKFGPAEMVQMMDAAKALIAVMLVSSVGIGIVLGAILAFRHRAADQSFQSGMPTVPALPTVPAQEIDATAPHSLRSPVPRANNLLRLVDLLGIISLIVITGGGFFLYYTSKRSDFKATYNNQLGTQRLPSTIEPQQQVRSDFEETYKQLGIQPLPSNVERKQQVQSRLAQLSREACYTDAIVGLGRAFARCRIPPRGW